jgi:hypothetical protein
MPPKFFFAPVLAALVALVIAFPVMAQDPNPVTVTGDPNLVSGSIDPNAPNGLNDNLIYNGEYTSNPDWMPVDESGYPMQATFQQYTNPVDGTTVLIPSVSTFYFMMENPQASGLDNTSAAMLDTYALATNVNSEYAMSIFQQAGYTGPMPATIGQVMATLLNGDVSGLGLSQDAVLTLLQSLNGVYMSDSGNFAAMLIYTQQTCNLSPAGCEALLAALAGVQPPGTITETAPQCPDPSVKVGRISASASKTAPLYPLVVSQDDTKRGADVTYTVRIEPTAYTTYTAVPQYTNEKKCDPVTGVCTTRRVFVKWKCAGSTTYYRESVANAHASASLTADSRAWIESGDLQIHYPGAFLHHPDFTVGGGGGSFQGNTYVWKLSGNIQVADPGEFALALNGRTSGTPVHAARGFNGGGSLMVYLREVIITK